MANHDDYVILSGVALSLGLLWALCLLRFLLFGLRCSRSREKTYFTNWCSGVTVLEEQSAIVKEGEIDSKCDRISSATWSDSRSWCHKEYEAGKLHKSHSRSKSESQLHLLGYSNIQLSRSRGRDRKTLTPGSGTDHEDLLLNAGQRKSWDITMFEKRESYPPLINNSSCPLGTKFDRSLGSTFLRQEEQNYRSPRSNSSQSKPDSSKKLLTHDGPLSLLPSKSLLGSKSETDADMKSFY